ncbi:MAG: cytidine deaminase [Gemmatimonas sp.]|nr:cytidine deaminase [Gemmatimonas sp.]
MLEQSEAEALLEEARQAGGSAYAPYSGFHVGAALLDAGGSVHTGANVENASYGLSTCAERAAVACAVGQGVREFRAIAVAGPDDREPCLPCGSCRQILHEFAPDLVVVVTAPGHGFREIPLSDLLPDAFGADTLAQSRHREEESG